MWPFLPAGMSSITATVIVYFHCFSSKQVTHREAVCAWLEDEKIDQSTFFVDISQSLKTLFLLPIIRLIFSQF